jgi:uncharacterized protein YjlB
MMAAREPLTFRFADDGVIPNNPDLPMLFYRGGIDLAGVADPAARIETVFADNGWGRDGWRNGIFPYAHYHSMIHEVLGIARGRASVRFGGDHGETVEVGPGDVALLPAGTGHQRLDGSGDLLVVGSYPPQGTYNLCRGSRPEHDRAVMTIPRVALPDSDPVHGAHGPLARLWRPA